VRPPQFLIIAVAATVLLYVLPGGRVVGRPLVLLSTLFHELGHGITALVLGGSFKRLTMYADGSGAAHFTMRASGVRRALVAAGGPLGPPFAAAGLFWAAIDARAAEYALYGLAGAIALACVIWVRNAFGVVFALAVSGGLGALGYFVDHRAQKTACAFLAIQMALSVFSRGDYLFKSYARTSEGNMPSDTAQIARELGLTYWFWGGLIGLVSIGVLGGGLYSFARFVR
jgi:hypothetical protein